MKVDIFSLDNQSYIYIERVGGDGQTRRLTMDLNEAEFVWQALMDKAYELRRLETIKKVAN